METYLPALAGGVLIGLAAVGLMYFNGRIAGISGIVGGLLSRQAGDMAWRAAFVLGVLVAGMGLWIVDASVFANDIDRSSGAILVAGLLVGVGTRLGSGCTSGHGVCGLARFSPRSLVATVTFVFAGMVAATLVTQFLGGVA